MVRKDEVLGYDFGSGDHFLHCSDGTKFPQTPNGKYTFADAVSFVVNKEAKYHGFEDTGHVGMNRLIRLKEFKGLLSPRLTNAGKVAVFVKKDGTSLQCNDCGSWKTKKSAFGLKCMNCVKVLDRDLNAAKNIGKLTRDTLNGKPYHRQVNFLRSYRTSPEMDGITLKDLLVDLKERDIWFPSKLSSRILGLASWTMCSHFQRNPRSWYPPPMITISNALSIIAKGMRGYEELWSKDHNNKPHLFPIFVQEGRAITACSLSRRLLRFGYKTNLSSSHEDRKMIIDFGWTFERFKDNRGRYATYFYPLWVLGECKWLPMEEDHVA